MRRPVLSTLLTISLLPALLTACSHRSEPAESAQSAAAPSPHVASPATPSAAGVCADLAAMPLRDKLAQLLMVGVRDAADADAVVTDQHVGGIFIGSWTDLTMLSGHTLSDIAGHADVLPLAVSVDEEGGRVSRLSTLIGSSPSAKELAAADTAEQVYQLALERGRKMAGLGITVDFAPVVDVVDATTDDDTVIGDRSFGSDPAKVAEYAGAYARGLRDAGLLPVLKHFPGHGHGSGDSHTAGVVATPPLAQLQDTDLVPYRTLVTEGPVAVMMGHLEVPGLTDDGPASLSPAAVRLLREGTGYHAPPFDGLVFSDDLSSMAAISDHYGVPEAVLRALQAGIDVALWITTDQVPAVLDRLEQAVGAGEMHQQEIDAALRRVAAVKRPDAHCAG